MNSPAHSPALESALERRRIRLRGLVQGVGFRPHVYRCAARLGITGSVHNGPEGVVIEAQGVRLDDFVQLLQREAPPLARIDSLIQAPMALGQGSGFEILETAPGAASGAAIPADTAICDACLGELFDPGNRRYLHPFIACCDCGPRFTMTRRLPYDRANTSMADFALCQACHAEYTDPASRRFHAEPVACHDCGPRLSGDIDDLASALGAGRIVAIKGLGGYHLACNARDHTAVENLRQRKLRDGKPFAVMVLNTASAARHVQLDATAAAALASPERPVVVLPAPGLPETGDPPPLSPALSPGLDTLGLMLPYTAIHYLLFYALLGKPPGRQWLDEANELVLVMTSANISGDPLLIDAGEAQRRLAGIADLVLHHDREIAARADDSVLRVTPGASTIIRRARGYTPHAISLAKDGPRVLALGAHLKSTVAMTRGDLAYISQHVGDLDTPAAVAFHAETAAALQAMLQARPQLLACDWNNDFASTRLAERLGASLDLPLVRVQHHHAHAGAVLAEHGREAPALAVTLDGHGTGSNGESWGGELLLVDGGSFERLGHFAPLALPGGDAAAREPWRMAAGVLQQLGRGDEIAVRFASQPLAPALAQLLATGAAPVTTAAGRLFDAAAGLLGVCDRASFEGEPPMRLEGLARQPLALRNGYTLAAGVLDFSPLLARLADCREPALGADWLHGTLVEAVTEWVAAAALLSGVDTVALCGGCFLNAHLAREIPARLQQRGLQVLAATAMPPNDGAISLGQAWVAQRSPRQH
ncbi:MAG: carbamoyltransferase HypF [Gammaproteobacteria bacterium]|nr:carbamoyltransferase HypF [Gammaproteobacteria bacterium]